MSSVWKPPPGDWHEIQVDGVPRTMRDDKETAIEEARLLALRSADIKIIRVADGVGVPFLR